MRLFNHEPFATGLRRVFRRIWPRNTTKRIGAGHGKHVDRLRRPSSNTSTASITHAVGIQHWEEKAPWPSNAGWPKRALGAARIGDKTKWFPAVTVVPPSAPLADFMPNLVLPALVLALVMSAHILRMTRAAVIEVAGSDFVQMARLKGVPDGQINRRHIAPSALIPTVNVIALTVAWLLGGVVVIEQVFNYPGLGTLMLQAIYNRDLPLVQAIALIFSAIFIGVNLTADLVIIALDPRLRT